MSLLKRYFGYEKFRPGQERLIHALLSGRDVLGVMPTGAGKSICYQIPALLLPGLTLVISPLISLMKDQVMALTKSGVPAAAINSSLSPGEYGEVLRRARSGAYKILYVAPERLMIEHFLHFVQRMKLALLVVDEAHCVSRWGQDFRQSYLDITTFMAVLPERPPVGAFTATATEDVKVDIEKYLGLKMPFRLTTGFDRPNLFFDVNPVNPREKLNYLINLIRSRWSGQSGIIYCATRKKVEAVQEGLCEHGLSATRYHAGLDIEERRRNQEDFVYDRMKIIVATNAFGMGIDKPNVRFVVHYNMPKDIESYYQEAGRAGRDGEKAQCVLLFSAGDIYTAKYFIDNPSENARLSDEEREAIHQKELWRLGQMTSYCKTAGCFRARLLKYFGEDAPKGCGNCGNCMGASIRRDITIEAQKILSAAVRAERKLGRNIGVGLIIHMLRGSQGKRIMELGLNELSTYGIMREVPIGQIRAYIDFLIENGYLFLTSGEYSVLRITHQGYYWLTNREDQPKILFNQRMEWSVKKDAEENEPERSLDTSEDNNLFEFLKTTRASLADEEKVPRFVIFSNATLRDMASRRPHTIEEFMKVSGVGMYKARTYGRVFLNAIKLWERAKSDQRGKEKPAART